MKRADVKRRTAEGVLFDTQIMVNPANTTQWIVLFKREAGRSFFLVDETSRCRPLPAWMH